MHTTVLANNIVQLTLSPTEHVALAHSLFEVMAELEPCDIRTTLGFEPVAAYEFVYSVFLAEEAARRDGIPWLQRETFHDEAGTDGEPLVTILFTYTGAAWHLTVEQLGFIELCVSEFSREKYDWDLVG